MKILLAAINAKYNHTNIAVRSIALYSVSKGVSPDAICFDEWTINQPAGEILRGIASHNPDMVLFSTYIWNAEVFRKILPDVKKILPEAIVGAGGPETGFYADGYLNENPALDFVMCGEGEETVFQIASGNDFRTVDGICYRDQKGKPVFTKPRELICDLSRLPFPYPEITDPDNKIYYYESSRGCPFSCAYCMSSLDKRVRFMPLERVFADLQRFLDAGVRLVKFVDRTYNLDENRYIAIWQYILDHHNNKTMFHFEIEAEFLSHKALDFLQKVPEGVMQFEIGVQSSNPETLKEVGRSPETAKIAENVNRIPQTIHSHLDLIAGLPYEDLESFGKSYDFVMTMEPDALQLGFLKVLHGTTMENYAKKNGWKWMENPPYETFSTPWLSYQEMLFLKDVETITDAYWNSGLFPCTIRYLGRKMGYWNFVSSAAEAARKNGALDVARAPNFWFDFLAESDFSADPVVRELLRFDFLRQKKCGAFPQWFERRYSKEKHLAAMTAHLKLLGGESGVKNAESQMPASLRTKFAVTDYEEFTVNPLLPCPEAETGKDTAILFIYEKPGVTPENMQIIV